MTPLSEAQAALANLRQTTLGFQAARQANPNAWLKTRNSKVEQYLVKRVNELGGSASVTPPLPAPAPAPVSPPPSPSSVFAGKGLFCTSEPGVVSGHTAEWVALQADPEGNVTPPRTNAQICYWQARATPEAVSWANVRGYPFIGQAENETELQKCLAIGPVLTVPKALIGNPTSWTTISTRDAINQGWDLILEWYKNAHPWETQPDAHGYPRFVNVCYGIYGEGVPGGNGYVQQIPLSSYTAVWHGSCSVWKAESMTPADWAVWDAL